MRLDLSAVAAHAPTTVDGAARQAAVLAPVIDRGGEDHLLFIERADHLGDHPGEMGFPGGSREPSDTDLAATALREAKEEIGLDPDTADIVGRLDDIRTVSGYSVRPFVGRVPAREYVPDGREVAEVAIVAVARLVDPANYTSEPHTGDDGSTIRLHFFDVGDYTVWGATGRMLVQLLELATDWRAPDGYGTDNSDSGRPV